MAITFGSKPAEFKYVELPFEALAAAGAAKQKRYDEGDKEITNINDTFLKIGSIKPDTKRKQELVDGYQQEIYQVVDQYSGDIGAALPKIKELQRKINYDMTYGELGAINNRYKSQQESIADIQKYNEEYIKSGGKNGMSGKESQALLDYETNELNNAPVQKNADGTWTTYQKYHRMPTINMYEEARQIAANMKPETIEQLTKLKAIGGGFYQHGKETKKYLTAEAIQMAVEQTMRNDPRFTSYLGWKNEITGKNKAVGNYLQQTLAQTSEGIQYLPGKDNAGNESMINPYAWKDQVLHEDFTNAAADAGRIFQQSEITRDVDYMHVAPKDSGSKTDPYASIPLSRPFETFNTGIQQLNSTVKQVASGAGEIAITADQAKGADGKLKPDVRAQTSMSGTGFSQTGPTKYFIKVDPANAYTSLTQNMNPLEKARLDYVIKNNPGLNGKIPTTAKEWGIIQQTLGALETAQVSTPQYSFVDDKTRKGGGAFYNANMAQFMYYDDSGVLTNALPSKLQKENRVYSGTELQQAGVKIEELVGKVASSTIAPKKIGGAGGGYTFASPDVVRMNVGGLQIDALVGKNKSQADANYLAQVLENGIASSQSTGLPMELFSGSNYVVSPVPNDPYGYNLQKFDTKGNVVESTSLKATNPVEMRRNVIELFNNNPGIQQELSDNLFR